jgi:hypothetical protein
MWVFLLEDDFVNVHDGLAELGRWSGQKVQARHGPLLEHEHVDDGKNAMDEAFSVVGKKKC